MSGRVFDGLSAEDKNIVMEAAKTACAKERAFNASAETDVIEGMKKRGLTVNTVKDIAPFRKRMDPLYQEYRTKIGPDVFDGWLAAVEGK
jgi:TRAP-type C4-dicarboxylate transport system substrate-binding protein